MPITKWLEKSGLQSAEEIVVLLGNHDEFPADFASRLADEGFSVIALQSVSLLEPFLARSRAGTVCAEAGRLARPVWELLRSLTARYPELRVVALSTERHPFAADRALSLGATALLAWPADTPTLIRALRGDRPAGDRAR